jgi:NodT family efflux transporter outer membrane factor (OMF) lipoprotein
MGFLSRCVALCLLGVSLPACMVGPDFKKPAAPKVTSYTRHDLPSKTVATPGLGSAGKSQSFEVGADIPAAWWTLFHSKALNRLICQGLANSPTLEAARATLAEAQATYEAQVGTSYYPQVTGTASGQRQRTPALPSSGVPSGITNLFNASVNVSYVLDVFGGARRQVEVAGAQVDYQHYQLEAAYLALTSNIVTTTVTAASLKAQIQATQSLINAQRSQLAIMKKQYRLGGISETELLTQETTLAQSLATLPPLEKSLAQSQHALAVLIGDFPSEAQLPGLTLNDLKLPTHLPLSLPSCLVRQRPDIRAAEALLHGATAQIGVATANLLPQLTLTGAYGGASTNPAGVFTSNAQMWNYAAQVLQPLFNGGALRATRRATIAANEAVFAQYRQTVLQGFQNVADTLRALDTDAKALKAEAEAETAAHTTLVLTREQLHLGGVSYLFLLNAQSNYEVARIARVQAQALRYADTAALFQALGGGWWNREKTK